VQSAYNFRFTDSLGIESFHSAGLPPRCGWTTVWASFFTGLRDPSFRIQPRYVQRRPRNR
jgi:hypothetical protein